MAGGDLPLTWYRLMDKKERYHSYLLRIWLHQIHGRSTWRASLDETRSGERVGFPDLRSLINYLCQKFPEEEDNQSELAEN